MVLDAQLIAAGMNFFGMPDMKSAPTKNGFSEGMKDNIKAVKHKYFHSVIKKFVRTYVLDTHLYLKHIEDVEALQEWDNYQAHQVLNQDGKYPCRFPGCPSSFKHDGKAKRRHELTHDPPPQIKEAPKITTPTQG